ncbi:uncharacterized protein LOC144106207 [Amblyomma americanum]
MSSFRKSTENIFKVPATPTNKKQGETAVKTVSKSAPQETRLDKSPWTVISPVAKYIHDKPVPPLVKTVRGRKWLSTKIGVTPLVTPTKPIVIKHTVSAETGNENETDLQDSVLEVIQH